MDTHNFEVFESIYESKSINKAARKLQLAQSNVTARLKHIESDYGVQLFERSTSGVTPTDAGQRFHEYATQIMTLDQELRRNLPHRKHSAEMSEVLFDFLVVHNKAPDLEQYSFDIAPSTSIDRIAYMNHDLVAAYHTPNNIPSGQVSIGTIPSHIYSTADSTSNAVYVNGDPNCAFRAMTLDSITDNVETHNINSLSGIVSLIKTRGGMALLPDYLAEESGLVRTNDHEYNIQYQIWQRNRNL